MEALISQTRRLKGDVDAVRRHSREENGSEPRRRWQRALYDLALHQLDDVDGHLAQVRDGPRPVRAPAAGPASRSGTPLSPVGSAEWNLLTGEADWSGELYQILGRDPAATALTLDELPSLALAADRSKLTAMVTDCLVDARPIDGEFRVVRPDGAVRTVHMRGEPVLGADGSTASMWAVLRDVSELRRDQRAVSETRDSLPVTGRRERPDRQAAAGPREAGPAWPGPLRPVRGTGLDLAAARLPGSAHPPGGLWYDACEIAGGEALLSVGALTAPPPGGTPDTALLVGTVRGLAMAGTRPRPLLGRLAHLLDTTARPPLDGAVCCAYRGGTRTLAWAHTGHPAPLLFRDGTGCRLDGQREGTHEITLEAGDLLLLYIGSPRPDHGPTATVNRLLALAPRLAEARSAQEGLRTVRDRLTEYRPGGDACVLAARVTA
ncbi:PAS domain-containing protein [Streptomyces ziwulingensis]|uniref:PAS domain-containing protein n=1 Tax=Streptomyces ziwulingensis TaxID=1045501 RepID=A0ABP9B8T1_9ACTN